MAMTIGDGSLRDYLWVTVEGALTKVTLIRRF